MLGDNEQCNICLDEMENMDTFKTPCNHIFHNRCVAQWLLINDTCPLCRTIVVKTDERNLTSTDIIYYDNEPIYIYYIEYLISYIQYISHVKPTVGFSKLDSWYNKTYNDRLYNKYSRRKC